ncbi:gephyrin-like molybdotransferase Glp [Luteimonas sp. JM171]|uniref:molybdopterin molybdotransferase MoeA n=1 Tax=Luteimonas sp. JM171 TaxID=1896164 RepID=UPI000856A5FD|nr:gephyrin-like molybdotransferase Glp [Luteimonas sp. JM171]AOH36939.1 molybdopterin molybdenumtransferase MoeA [Luteimonas sp. JM171]
MTEFPTRISYAEAAAIIASTAAARRLPVERCALQRAHGRILATDLTATIAQPPFDNSAMDGFALRHADLAAEGETVLALAGEQFAGTADQPAIGPGQCVRITTGAPMPPGADTVVMKENTRVDGNRVHVLGPTTRGRHVRLAGEDTAPGERLLQAGDVLTPSRIALCAMQGLAELDVRRPPTVAVFSTGDELVEPGMSLGPGQIYNSNRELLMGLLRAEGLEPVAWPTLADDPAHVESSLRHAGNAFDLVITCGGVSAGEKDYLPELMQTQGRVLFWKSRLKPGMPVLFAEGGGLGEALFLCLPGNPVSVLATWLALGRPLVDALQARPPRPKLFARLATAWSKRHERLEFLRGRLVHGEDGVLSVEPNPADGSNRMHAAADSDALLVLEEGPREYAAGTAVEVISY